MEVNKDTKKSWDYLMENNGSFYDKVSDICEWLNIQEEELKKYWENSAFGLIYIRDYVWEHKKLP